MIDAQILNIVNKANYDIQRIKGISKYQEFFGQVFVCSHTNDTNSIKRQFQDKWFRLDNTIPSWSHPLIYDIAVKNSKILSSRQFMQPEDFVAMDYAKKTMEQLEQLEKLEQSERLEEWYKNKI